MLRRRSLGWPITLGVVMIVLLVALTVGWIVVTVMGAIRTESPGVYWTVFALGITFLLLVLIGVVLYLLLSIKEISLNQRQSNFVDSVTHELKSPIASLKLYLQTLDRRRLTEQQQADFHRFMAEDLARLDSLIDHLLDAARLDTRPQETELENVDLVELLRGCAETARIRYGLPADTVRLDLSPAVVRARPMDLEIIFRNLVDNALKYSGDRPQIEIECRANGHSVAVTRIADNGPGIPVQQRRRIFGRFVRLGKELERERTGTGLGLFIVRTLVKQLHGRVTASDRGTQPGTVFEVELPLAEPT